MKLPDGITAGPIRVEDGAAVMTVRADREKMRARAERIAAAYVANSPCVGDSFTVDDVEYTVQPYGTVAGLWRPYVETVEITITKEPLT